MKHLIAYIGPIIPLDCFIPFTTAINLSPLPSWALPPLPPFSILQRLRALPCLVRGSTAKACRLSTRHAQGRALHGVVQLVQLSTCALTRVAAMRWHTGKQMGHAQVLWVDGCGWLDGWVCYAKGGHQCGGALD